MLGRVLEVSQKKIDKRGKPYVTVKATCYIPCYAPDVAGMLEPGEKYSLVLLQKHEFVELTGARKLAPLPTNVVV